MSVVHVADTMIIFTRTLFSGKSPFEGASEGRYSESPGGEDCTGSFDMATPPGTNGRADDAISRSVGGHHGPHPPYAIFQQIWPQDFFLTSDLLGSCGYGAGSDDFPLFLERRFLWNALWSFVG
ncbi:hypothetical protein SCLCIDRAFT_833151 [Scleroderma citrinum Foug A]|uniref:Uncharacterized protein n=1 Tax=Scleroderma citrinum Foug A TaxID=1036808 RepID=A0A0C3E1B3_9AGAM|nr:hypothetical protein SCLCIDRAFT_833151 [Scleroderma citrinum Foug A]